MVSITIRVAQVDIKISSEMDGIINSLEEMYKNHIVQESSPPYAELRIIIEDMNKYIDNTNLPVKSGKKIIQTNYIYSSCYDIDSKKATLITNINYAYSFVEEYLIVLTSYLVLDRKKIMFHCAAVSDEDRNAYIFYGPSGIGKSTLSKNCFSTGYKVISDDLVIIEKLNQQNFNILKTPFARDKSKNEDNSKYKIRGFYRLHHSDQPRVEEMDNDEKLVSFLGNIWSFHNHQEIIDSYISLVQDILKCTPCYNLYLKKDTLFSELIF